VLFGRVLKLLQAGGMQSRLSAKYQSGDHLLPGMEPACVACKDHAYLHAACLWDDSQLLGARCYTSGVFVCVNPKDGVGYPFIEEVARGWVCTNLHSLVRTSAQL
jgi:hypothetical protein